MLEPAQRSLLSFVAQYSRFTIFMHGNLRFLSGVQFNDCIFFSIYYSGALVIINIVGVLVPLYYYEDNCHVFLWGWVTCGLNTTALSYVSISFPWSDSFSFLAHHKDKCGVFFPFLICSQQILVTTMGSTIKQDRVYFLSYSSLSRPFNFSVFFSSVIVPLYRGEIGVFICTS